MRDLKLYEVTNIQYFLETLYGFPSRATYSWKDRNRFKFQDAYVIAFLTKQSYIRGLVIAFQEYTRLDLINART